MTATISQLARQACTNAVLALLNTGGSGLLRVYTGAKPATPETAAAGTLLAELPLSNPAFGNADLNGLAVAAAITEDSDPLAAGTMGYVRLVDGNGTAVADLDVGVTGSGEDVQFNTLDVQLGIPVRVSALTFTKLA